MYRFEKDGYSITYRYEGEPHIQWNHVDGPLLTRADGSLHWLTLIERIKFFFGIIKMEDLDPDFSALSREQPQPSNGDREGGAS